MGDSGKLRFYERDHESKMRLPQTHSHTSNRLAMEPGTRDSSQSLTTAHKRSDEVRTSESQTRLVQNGPKWSKMVQNVQPLTWDDLITQSYHSIISLNHITQPYHSIISLNHITQSYHSVISLNHITQSYHSIISLNHTYVSPSSFK